MKRLLGVILVSALLASCATGASPSSGQSTTQNSSSAEAQARELTNKMKTILGLDKPQEDRVLTINVVNQKLLQRIRQNNEQNLAASAKESYHKELKGVLSTEQFSKFRSSFPDL